MIWIFFFLLLGLLCLGENAQTANWGLDAANQPASQKILKKSAPIVIAVIDTGADTGHPQLQGALWKNPGETGLDSQGRDKSTNGIDDDGNGFVDDVSGWNFAGGDSDLADHHGHGTHIAGLIAGAAHGAASEGVAHGARIMVLKYYDPHAKGVDNLQALIESIRYAIRMKAKIINYSGGGFFANREEKKVIEEASRKGILFVAAAGNESANSDRRPFYPADYDLPNLISVGAHNPAYELLPSSNYGIRTVDLAAPGLEIESSLPEGRRGTMTGTSQATAFVTGAAALLLTLHPDWKKPEQIVRHLRNSARFEPVLAGKVRTQGRLDLLRTLAISDRGRSFSGYAIRTLGTDVKMRLPAARQD